MTDPWSRACRLLSLVCVLAAFAVSFFIGLGDLVLLCWVVACYFLLVDLTSHGRAR